MSGLVLLKNFIKIMKTKFYLNALFACAIALTSAKSFAQGLNNPYKLDQKDIEYSLRLLGVTPYKFPLATDSPNVYLDFSIDVYHDTTRVSHGDMLDVLRKNVPPQYIKQVAERFQLGKDTEFFRVGVLASPTGTDPTFKIQLNYKGFFSNESFDIDTAVYTILASRAYTFKMPKPGEKVPIIVGYTNKRKANQGQSFHCPGDAMPEVVRKYYDFSYVVYMKLVTL